MCTTRIQTYIVPLQTFSDSGILIRRERNTPTLSLADTETEGRRRVVSPTTKVVSTPLSARK